MQVSPMQSNLSRSRPAILLALLSLPACGTTKYTMGVVVDPPTATVYINGELVGPGGKRTYELDFSKAERVCLQATAYGYKPAREIWTRQQVVNQLAQYAEFTVNLEVDR